MNTLETSHPDGLFCPICGCDAIHYWPELVDWNKFSEEKKKSYEICAACGFGGKDFVDEDDLDEYNVDE